MKKPMLRRLWLAVAAIAAMAFPQFVDVIDRVTDIVKVGLVEVDSASDMDSTSYRDRSEEDVDLTERRSAR